MESLVVDTSWLADRGHAEGIIVVDARPPHHYSRGHLPGAINLPLFLLANPAGGIPESAVVSRRLGQVGIAPDSYVVAYDDGEGATAAQLLWSLFYVGHRTAAVLDGGVALWATEGRPLDTGRRTREPAQYDAGQVDEGVACTMDAVLSSLGAPDTIVVDVRTPAEYLGAQRTAARNGHIPGAVNVDVREMMMGIKDGIGHLATPDVLQRLYDAAGVSTDKRVIVHCQSGHRSSAAFLVLKHLGYPDVRNYVGGWQEWGNSPNTPVENE
ncbi:MAG: sulfurtransferase [Chloroflexota bacterium]